MVTMLGNAAAFARMLLEELLAKVCPCGEQQ